jgi:hypothetical protein
MNNIELALEKNGFKQEELPKAVQNKILHYEGLAETLEESRTEFEEEEDEDVKSEIGEKIEEAEEYLKELEKGILNSIQILKEKLDKLNEPPTPPAPIDEPPTPPTDKVDNPTPPTPPVPNNHDDKPKKKGGAIKWIFGITALLLTLGAVNTLNRE